MKKLTIICLDGSTENFKKSNSELIGRIGGIEDAELLYCTEKDLPGASAYGRFLAAVKAADSEYLMFVNDCTVLRTEDLEKLLEETGNGSPVITLRLRDKREREFYQSAADTKFPFYFGKYVFRKDFLETGEAVQAEDPYFRERLIIRAASLDLCLSACGVSCTADEYLETKLIKYARAFDRDWYTKEIEDLVIPLLEGGAGRRQQELILWLIWNKFRSNRKIYNKKILDPKEIGDFNEAADRALRLLDDEIFFSETSVRKLGIYSCCYAYGRVHEEKPEITVQETENGTAFYYNGTFAGYDLITARIYTINKGKNCVKIDFVINGDAAGAAEDGLVGVYANGTECPYSFTGISFDTTVFGNVAYSKRVYTAEIPLADEWPVKIHFGLKGPDTRLALSFMRVDARLTEKSQNSYCNMGGLLLRYADESIVITKGHSDKALERAYRKDISNIRTNRKEALAATGLMRLYKAGLYKPAKPVWIFFDKLYKGGDNAEHLFSYAFENIDYAEAYYIIRKDTEDYKRLRKKYGSHVLAFNSLRQKLMALYADVLFATHKGVYKYCGFGNTLQEFFRGELSSKTVCIQHGLTIQDMPENQNRVLDNTVAYFCASPVEIKNLSQPVYGYSSDQLHLTGLPRYDGLHSNDRKQILIAPTWRRELVIQGNRIGDSKEYNPRFKKSRFYKVYNDLINNETLLKCAEENGYRIVFLLHPTIGVQKDDFRAGRGVELVNGAEALYEPYLTESSLMVTDYSGVQFDFAYMKKPVIYYHPEELPPQYDNSHFSYDDDGFGPVISRNADLIETLCDYMRRGCKMEELYVKRVDRFFPYTDNKNCERICSVIKELFY